MSPWSNPDYGYWVSCVDMPGPAPGELVRAIVDHPNDRRVTYKTFARHADLAPLRAVDHPAMYRISSASNWAISFHRSELPTGAPVYYFAWSGIEFFFVNTPVDLAAELAAMKPQANPVIPRLRHIGKSYPDFVVLATVWAWGEATGEHAARDEFNSGYEVRVVDFETPGGMPEHIEWFAGVLQHLGAPTSTRFDRYLPWLAREFNRIYKPYTKLAKKRGMDPFLPHWDQVSLTLGRVDELQGWHPLPKIIRGTQTLARQFRAVVDWAEATGVDLNQMDWPLAIASAETWASEQVVLNFPQGEVLYRWADGWTVQELTTPEQLNAEAEVMQHCVDTYAEDIAAGYVRVFSLRDPSGLPHVTMEWDPDEVFAKQLRGKQNALAKREYVLRMIAFRRDALPRKSSHMRAWPEFVPGLFDKFQEDFLGAWLVGEKKSPGPVDPWSEDFDRVVLYKGHRDTLYEGRQPALLVYKVEDVDEAMQGVEQFILDNTPEEYIPDYEEDEDAHYEWMADAVDESVRQMWIGGGRKDHALLSEEYTLPQAGAFPWEAWVSTGELIKGGDDEIIDSIAVIDEGLRVDSPSIPAGVVEAKRRLLQ